MLEWSTAWFCASSDRLRHQEPVAFQATRADACPHAAQIQDRQLPAARYNGGASQSHSFFHRSILVSRNGGESVPLSRHFLQLSYSAGAYTSHLINCSSFSPLHYGSCGMLSWDGGESRLLKWRPSTSLRARRSSSSTRRPRSSTLSLMAQSWVDCHASPLSWNIWVMAVLSLVDITSCLHGLSWSLKALCWCIAGRYNDEGCFRAGNSLSVWIVYITKTVVLNADGTKRIFWIFVAHVVRFCSLPSRGM